jgi:hypothetical protein
VSGWVRWFSAFLLGWVAGSRADAGEPPSKSPARVHSRDGVAWVFAEPRKSARMIGYVRPGQSVRIRQTEPKPGPGCPRGFLAVEPIGWVCVDRTATLDSADVQVRMLEPYAPGPGPLPFEYALSNGAPMYRRLPSREEWQASERFYPRAGTYRELSWGNRAHAALAEERPIAPTVKAHPSSWSGEKHPPGSRDRAIVRREIPLGSMLAYRGAVAHEGRTFLLSVDGTFVPADRVRPYRRSEFRGLELGAGVDLPLAWIRGRARPKYLQQADGRLVLAGAEWPPRSYVALDPDLTAVEHSGRRYLLTKERQGKVDRWILEEDATVVRRANPRNWGIAGEERWILVSITLGTLVAYQGTKPVFATLISPGAGGVPRPGQDLVKASTTPLGTYRISFKHRTTTMSPEQGENRKFWIAEVPHTQYFNPPFALHTAYWHEEFGELMSAGCINLSPLDGQWLFDWTGPRVPPEWNGAAPSRFTGPGSVVVVVR